MDITLSELLVWLIVGGLAGWSAGFVVKRKKEGFGRWTNLGIGLVGALIGGIFLDLFKIDLGLPTIEVQDLLAAFVGSLLFLVGLSGYRFWRKRKTPPESE